MDFAFWSVLIGVLLVLMALSGTVLSRLPLSTAMFYLAVGVMVSPQWLDMAYLDLAHDGVLVERMTEVVVLLALFTAGLKLSPGLKDRRWMLPVRLAVTSMLVTVLLVTATGIWLLGLPLGAAILLGGILAPTDPVLASDVQVHDHADSDKLRFALTGEGGMNDGTAFPVVMLGLALLGLHDTGGSGWRWFLVDGVWATFCGVAVGGLLGSAVGWLVLYLRRVHKEAVGLDDFLALGLIALSYGVAVVLHGYGFLAVFAAGVALRQLEQRETASAGAGAAEVDDARVGMQPGAADALAVDMQHAPAFMAHAVLGFNEKLERIGEVGVVMAVGILLWSVSWEYLTWWFVPLLLLVIRPVSVMAGMIGSRSSRTQRGFIGWFGIRGIGSLYYLAYAVNHGLSPELAAPLVATTLAVVCVSIVAHGVSVTPLMGLYERTRPAARRR
jgi:NhaP-type Na+/H+ or K+/H+ antiporter